VIIPLKPILRLEELYYLNQPQLPDNSQYVNDIQNQPSLVYNNKKHNHKMVVITNDNKINIKLYSEAFDKRNDTPSVYTEKN